MEYKFKNGDIVKHVKTGGKYWIVGTPDVYVIEATGEPAYAYRQVELSDKPQIWVRAQAIMEEEGKFVVVDPAPPKSRY